MLIRPASFWKDRDVAMLLGRRVIFVEPKAQRVSTFDGETISYGSSSGQLAEFARRPTCGGSKAG
jgi:3-phenylpropionate/trans-cinnamate dioxygenase ferredoxin reductase subunit